MFAHVGFEVSDLARSARFYDALFHPLGGRRMFEADAAIAYFEKTLPEAKSPAVQRAIRLQLVDLYKAVGKQDQALDQLKTLMTAEPGPNDLQQPAPPPPGAGPNR